MAHKLAKLVYIQEESLKAINPSNTNYRIMSPIRVQERLLILKAIGNNQPKIERSVAIYFQEGQESVDSRLFSGKVEKFIEIRELQLPGLIN